MTVRSVIRRQPAAFVSLLSFVRRSASPRPSLGHLHAIAFQMISTSTKSGRGSTPDSSSLKNGSPQEARPIDRKAERPPIADVGINLTDPVFTGVYHGKKIHDSDLDEVLQRAIDIGCRKFMVTGSSLEESKKAVRLAEDKSGLCYATVGVHPCSSKEFDEGSSGPDAILEELEALVQASKKAGHVVAFGEIGLDYDRLFLTGKEQQLKYFERQLELATRIQLPLFLHSRAASEDFERLLRPRLSQLPKLGLVHSFTGTIDEMKRLVDMGLDIGVNGCSLKSEENLAVVKEIPLERLQIETDGPWCEMRASHASAAYLRDGPPMPKSVKKERFERGLMVKGRNEPVTLPRVAHVVARVKGISFEELCRVTWSNSIRMFGLGESSGIDGIGESEFP